LHINIIFCIELDDVSSLFHSQFFFGVNELDSISAWGFGTIIIKLGLKFDGGIGKARRWICFVGQSFKALIS
jgi:hypothetical protein